MTSIGIPSTVAAVQLKHFPQPLLNGAGPGILRNSPLFGNHLAATRRIEIGELIYEEVSILEFPDYGPDRCRTELKNICLNCYGKLSDLDKCAQCAWPLCRNGVCDTTGPHQKNECPILSGNKIPHLGLALEYTSVEILRCLLLRRQNPSTWNILLDLEPHIQARKNDWRAVQDVKYVTDFIRNRCGIQEFDEHIISRMAGVMCINKFGVHDYLKDKSGSYLFDRLSYLLHDCNPNSVKEYALCQAKSEDEENKGPERGMKLRIIARRTILPGQPITIDYLNQIQTPNLIWTVQDRRETLKEQFYFECRCQRCLDEMMG